PMASREPTPAVAPSVRAAEALATSAGPARVLELDAAAPDRAAWTAALAAHTDGATAGVVSLLAMGQDGGGTGVGGGVLATVVLTQAVLDSGRSLRLWALTQGAVEVGADDPVRNPGQTQTWGVGRVAALEHPAVWGGLIDLPATGADKVIGRELAALVDGVGGEDQVALRSDGAYGCRLVRARPGGEPAGGTSGGWRPSGTVLITGGTGGLGAHVARWMADNGAEHLVLLSRRGLDAPGAARLRGELEQRGARVTVAACDLADRAELSALLAKLHSDGAVIRSVVHTAGVASYNPVKDIEPAELGPVMAAKVEGAILLDELLADAPLDAFVLFSSNAGVWGSGTQGLYAAANAFLDGFAAWRRSRGRPATSIAWGAWAGAGMVEETGTGELLQRQGVLAMDPELAVAALVRALEQDERFLAVADVDWEAFAPTFTTHRPSPLIGGIAEVREALDAPAATGRPGKDALPDLGGGLRSLDSIELLSAVTRLVRVSVAEVLGFASVGEGGAADAAEVGRDFRDLGFDSLTAVQLRNRLNAATGLRLPAAVVFDHPNAEELAAFVCAELSAKTV
ncbi:beta-ketoacyl reductase, partial [Kitasatospora sp. NPDC093806]|uniref:beta-ketoacyl reductase n=1 Tax=Kitasatospora sp. NPDC093806 TaxID=3155075 RepID=UPI003413300E